MPDNKTLYTEIRHQFTHLEALADLLVESLSHSQGVPKLERREKLYRQIDDAHQSWKDQFEQQALSEEALLIAFFDQLSTNTLFLKQMLEIQLHILSAQTGESVLSLRNRLLDQ